MVGQHVLALGLLFKSLGQGLIDVHVGDIAVLEDDTEHGELGVQIGDHLPCHISLQVENLGEPDSVDEVSDAFVYLSIEELIETTSTKTIDEVLNFLLLSGHAEGEVQINTDVSVVLGGAVVDGRIVVNDSLCQHASDARCAAIAPLGAWGHDTSGLAAALLECGETGGDVELEVATAAAVATLHHDDDRLLIGLGLGQELK